MALPQPQAREHIRKRRRQLGLSLDEVGFAMSLSTSALSRWERGLGQLPGDVTETDVERILDEIERERTVA